MADLRDGMSRSAQTSPDYSTVTELGGDARSLLRRCASGSCAP